MYKHLLSIRPIGYKENQKMTSRLRTGIIFMIFTFFSFCGMATTFAQVRVVGYIPTWVNFPGIVNTTDLTKVTHLNIAFANPNSSGSLTGVSSSNIATVVNAAHAKNVKVLMSIGGAGAPASTYKTLLSNSTNMNNFVNSMVQYAVNNNLDGIDVDIEGDVLDGSHVTSSQYQSFVTQLASSLHAQNKIMTAALATWFGNYVTNTAAAQFDFINVMSYDAAIPGTGDPAGQHSSYQFAVDDFNYWHGTKGVPGSKLTVGVPFYGYGWGTYAQSGNDEISYASIVNTYSGAENNDQVGSGSNAIYYNGIPTIKKKTQFAIANASGVMIWELAEDATGSKSLLNAINEVINGSTVNQLPVVSITSPSNNASFTAPASVTINATASDVDGSVSKVEFYNGSTLLFTDNSSPYSYTWSNVAAGTYTLTAKATDNQNATSTSSAVTITVSNPVTQSPYGGQPWPIPGTIQAENYDLGGQGIAYNETTTTNQGGAYRTSEAVDVETCTDTGGGYDVGYIIAGEWLEYTVNVTTSGTYNLAMRVAAITSGKTFHVEMDGSNISGTLTVPNTGGWQNWQTITANNINLTTGQKVLRIAMDSPDFNINYFTFTTATTVNQAPTVSLTAPSNNSSYIAPASVTISATASDADGTVSKVDFYNGSTLLASDATSPYSYSWTNVAAGTYTITAKATDNQGATTVSSAVTVTVTNPTVNQAPTVSLTAPSNNSSYTAPASITISATASDADGTVSKVDFYNGSTLLASDATSPYSYSWTNVAAGTYTITAKATDNQGATAVSSVVTVTVTNPTVNQAPTVSLTAPANNSSYTAPASIAISATASDADGTISKVDFYSGSTLLYSDNSSPYSYSWTSVAAGTYTITAKATDNAGASTTSSAVTVTVNANTNACSGIAQYVENGGYVAGSKVKNTGSQYECKPWPYSGWCNGAAWAYAPGTGMYWTDAWTLVGSCTARTSDDNTTASSALTNVPNPCTQSTTVQWSVGQAGDVTVELFNKNGQKLKTLVEGYFNEGTYTVILETTDLKADLYIIKYSSANGVSTQKMIKAE